MSRQSCLAAMCIAALAASAGVAHARPGPDVIVGDIVGTQNYSLVGGVRAYAIGTTSCNIGDQELIWNPNTTQHPVISQNLYRLANGRFEQIGQAWLKHGFCALQGTVCSSGCQPSPLGCGALGILCSDPYSSSLNGDQGGLGPKFEVNATTGAFPVPFTGDGTTGNAIFKRLQARDVDVDPAQNAGALYFVSSMYIQPQDALANNDNNNESYRSCTFNASRNMSLTGSTQRERPGIQAWKDQDASVTITNVDVANDGRFVVASKATSLGGGQWHYEYAVQNLNSHRSGQGFSIPLPAGAVVTNVGFRDVDYHSGEPFSLTDWTPTVTASSVSWATQTFAQNANANALRWDTLYNFRFDANVAPGTGSATIALFRSGSPASVTGGAVVPGGGPPPPPSNDMCANATTVGNGVSAFDTANATSDPATQNNCETSTTIFNDVWYQYSTPCAGNVSINLCGASFDTKLAVYTACPAGNNTAITCNDDSATCGVNSLQSAVAFAATAGTTYFIRVGAFVNGATGTGNMTIAGPTCGPVPPANDLCANATTVSAGATPYNSTNAGTDGPAEPGSCNFFNDTQISADVWFRYTTPCAGAYTFALCGSSYDTEIALYNNTCPTTGGTVIGCNDDSCGLQSSISPTLAGNTTYLVRVGGYQGATGPGTLTITAPTCGPTGPVNDNCANATSIASYGATPFTNTNATTDGPAAGNCNTLSRDVWFTYTACAAGSHTLDTCAGGNFDTVLQVYSGSCGALTQIVCNDDTSGCGSGGLSSRVTWNATAGTAYRFRVSGFNGAQGSGTLTLSGPACTPPGPFNDLCANRAGVSLGVTPFTTVGATTDGPNHAGCQAQPLADVWFNYPSQCNGVLILDTCNGTDYDSVLAVYEYDGTCASINDSTLRGCNDDSCGLQSSITIPVSSGQNYAIRIGGFNGSTGTGNLTLACVTCPCDWNDSGTLTSQDFFDFLAGFFSDNGDYNNDGVTTSQDFFDFLLCFLSPPAGCPA